MAAQRQLRHRQLRLGGHPFAISGNQVIYITGSGSNYGQYSNKKVDDLFTQAMGEFDDAKAAELGNQIDQQITADMATIPLYQKPTFIAWRNTFAGIGDNSTQDGPSGTPTLGAEDRLEPGERECSRRGPVGDRRPASASSPCDLTW